jgi:homoserine kinase
MPSAPGLLSIALSGSGPTVIALATDHFDDIGKSIALHFERHRLPATVTYSMSLSTATSSRRLFFKEEGRRQ